jgi:transglutaminase-like putative cysteine protease
MSGTERLRNLDYAALAMMAVYPVVFRSEVASLADFLTILMIIGSAILLWLALSGVVTLGSGRRLLVVVALLLPVVFMSALSKAGLLFGLYLVPYLTFSVKGDSWGRCLRCLSGIAVSSVLFTSFPAVFGLPMSLLALLVFIGGLLSIWSGMNLDKSIWWFAKRSFRKETFFLLVFLTGIAAIGLRQAQLYSERQFGISGLSASLSPGGVKKLLLSDELALRVKFKNAPPFDPSQAYVRAVALDVMSGFDWSVGPSRIMANKPPMGGDFENELSLSPRHSQFTPVLDYGVRVFDDAKTTATTMALPRDNGVFSVGYFDVYWKHYRSVNSLTPVHANDHDDFSSLLQVDKKTAEQLHSMAKNISQDTKQLSEFVSHLSRFYRDSNFTYSLNLKREPKNLENFLSVTKEGFCEHYAAASAVLARLAGFPARVVSGFLGGFWEAGKLTLFVRDLDAHAWNEFWDRDKKSWVRFDAVALLAPERIEYGGANFLRRFGYDVADDTDFHDLLWITDLTITVNNFLAGLNTGFSLKASETFVEYGEEMALFGALGLTISYIVLVQRRHRRNARHPERQLLVNLRKILGAKAPQRNKGEPIFDWLMRCAETHPDVSEQMVIFAAAHSRYSYSEQRNKDDLRLMSDCLKKAKGLLK